MKRTRHDSENASVLRTLVMLCIAVLAAGAGLIYWQYTGYAALQQRVLAAEQQVEEGKAIAQRLQQTQERYQQAAQQLQHLEQSVNERAYIPTLLKQLESHAKTYRLKVLSVRPSNQPIEKKRSQDNTEEGKQGDETSEKRIEPYEKQLIDVSVRGRFWDTMQFLDSLTRFPKILAVERVQFRPHQRREPSDPFEVETQMALTAFIFRETQGGTQP